MVMLNPTSRYNAVEAFLFDFFVAPGVFRTLTSFRDAILSEADDGCRVLDVGCGGGQLAIDLKQARADLEVTGLDSAASQVGRARARAAEELADVSFVHASAMDMPFPEASFGLVCSVDCLKHWPDRAQGLRECIRVLQPGGTLLITEVDRDSTIGDGLRFARSWNVPSWLQPLAAVPFFLFARRWSLTREQAWALARPLALDDLSVGPGPGGVNWTLRARRPGGPSLCKQTPCCG